MKIEKLEIDKRTIPNALYTYRVDERKSVRYRFELYWVRDLLRKMIYYFRIGDKIGAIEQKYAYIAAS